MSDLKDLILTESGEDVGDDVALLKVKKEEYTEIPNKKSWVGGLRQRAKKYRDKILSNKFAVTSQFVVCSKVLTDTIPSRNCDILVTVSDTADDDSVMWLVTRLRARVPELVLHLRHHSKTEEYGFYLTASPENLLRGAEELALKKQVKPKYGGGFKEFVYEDREYFEGALDGWKGFLKSEERQSIVRHLLMNLRAEEGDELKGVRFHEGQAIVPILLSKKIITQVLPLHSHDDLTYLRNNWVQAFFHKQPLDKICDYFGVKIAMYFAYLGYYTKCLLWPAIIGFTFWFLGGTHQYTDDICFVAFAFFNVVWATLYLEGWKRKEAVHAYTWGTMDKEDELLVEPRALFYGEIKKSQVTGRYEPSYPAWKRSLFRYFISFPIILVCLTVVFIVMWAILEMQNFINKKVFEDKIPYFCKFLPKILLAVCISLLDEGYKRIATWLNDMENHRLEITYENNLIIKLVLFVNSFLSLFYIAFYLQDMTQLQEHLGALLITRQVIGNLKESIQPYMMEKIRLFRFWYNLVVSMGPEALENQMKMISEKKLKRKRTHSGENLAEIGKSDDTFGEGSDAGSTEDAREVIGASGEVPDDDELNADMHSTMRWRGTGVTIDSIKEEDEEEEYDGEDKISGTIETVKDDEELRQVNKENKILLEKVNQGFMERDVFKDIQTNTCDDDEDDEDDDDDDDLPEITIRDSGTALPGGFLGRKRGFGMRYGGQRKVSLMTDVKCQLPQLKILSKKRAPTKMSQAEVESVMKRYEDTYEDYLEMFIQFGYVTLFSSAFPLAALCALFNNIIEIRSDAFKLCVSLQRPFGQRVENIGIWQKALEVMSIMAVMVNSALIGMSGLAERLFPGWGTVERIVFIVILEHFVLGLKLLMAYAIPDVPNQVAEEKARLEFLRREALKNLWVHPDQMSNEAQVSTCSGVHVTTPPQPSSSSSSSRVKSFEVTLLDSQAGCEANVSKQCDKNVINQYKICNNIINNNNNNGYNNGDGCGDPLLKI